MYTWDYALAQNCKLVAAVDPELERRGYQPVSGQLLSRSSRRGTDYSTLKGWILLGPALASSWMLSASASDMCNANVRLTRVLTSNIPLCIPLRTNRMLEGLPCNPLRPAPASFVVAPSANFQQWHARTDQAAQQIQMHLFLATCHHGKIPWCRETACVGPAVTCKATDCRVERGELESGFHNRLAKCEDQDGNNG